MSIQREDRKVLIESFLLCSSSGAAKKLWYQGGENRVNEIRLVQSFVCCVKGGLENFYCVIQSMEFARV